MIQSPQQCARDIAISHIRAEIEQSNIRSPELVSYEVKKTGQYEHTVIFTYSDGSKKSFDGKNWKFCEDVYDRFH